MRANVTSLLFATAVAITLCSAVMLRAAENPVSANAEDRRLKLARLYKERIESQEREIAQNEEAAFNAIQEAIAKLPTGSLQAQQQTLAGFRQATVILGNLARQLLDRREQLLTDIGALNQVTKAAAPAFRETSKLFEQYAKEEPYEEIKKDYVTLAQAWSAMADLMEKRADRFAGENKEITETIQYLERTAIFLERLQQHLDSIPNLDALQDREQYLEQLRRYIRAFEQFRDLFRRFNEALRSDALSADLRSRGLQTHSAAVLDRPRKPVQPLQAANGNLPTPITTTRQSWHVTPDNIRLINRAIAAFSPQFAQPAFPPAGNQPFQITPQDRTRTNNITPVPQRPPSNPHRFAYSPHNPG